ncbi:hypothetical protein TNIN_188581 [Trichonephila inaurata madagascariensis]|uniref:Uncharacterized protein n=1 Tax=Trichonephila inaurata madagascariensis TaxID=2747483 RepID=A0A8X6MJ86_9ARAC|nr:hypothetical protein TNIN_188581 [Trichonephila inaurata madagascariensis]
MAEGFANKIAIPKGQEQKSIISTVYIWLLNMSTAMENVVDLDRSVCMNQKPVLTCVSRLEDRPLIYKIRNQAQQPRGETSRGRFLG